VSSLICAIQVPAGKSQLAACCSLTSTAKPNPALNLAPFSRWTLRDKAAQRRLALRCSGKAAALMDATGKGTATTLAWAV